MSVSVRPESIRAGVRFWPSVIALAVPALLLGTALRSFVNADEKLWFDEIWTGAIAMQDWHGAFDMLHSDVIAPLFFVSAWAWSKLFGLSDVSLRMPGMITAIAAAFLPWLMLRRRLPRFELALLTVLIALWIPGLYEAQEARTYGFVLFLSVLHTVCFFRVLQSEGDRLEIAGWAMAGVLLGMTHYMALLLSALQGLTLVALFWRTRLVALVLAGLAFLPVFGMIWLQSGPMDAYMHYDYFWLKKMSPYQFLKAAAYIAGDKYFAPFFYLFLAGALVVDARATRGPATPNGPGLVAAAAGAWKTRIQGGLASPLFVTGCLSLLAVMLFLGLTMLRPLFLPRYLMPYVPGVFMLLVWAIAAMPECGRRVGGMLAGLFFLGAFAWAGVSVNVVDKGLTWGPESALLEKAGVTDMLFFLDQGYPIPYREDILSKVYGFFFVRDHYDARAHPFTPDYATGDDPRPRLARYLATPGHGLIWTLHLGPGPGPVPADRAGRKKRIRERGFSSVYDFTALATIPGVTCRTMGADWYRKYVCYSARAR